MKCLLNIHPQVFGVLMMLGFIVAQAADGIMGSIFVWITFVMWEIWYMVELESMRAKAEEHYASVVRRFQITVALALLVESAFCLISIFNILNPDVLTSAVLGIAGSARFLSLSVLLIWQVSMLLNTKATTMTPEQYKDERGKIVLLLIFAPIGAIFHKK